VIKTLRAYLLLEGNYLSEALASFQVTSEIKRGPRKHLIVMVGSTLETLSS